jgi:hydrogenase maturation protein HypF
MNQDNVAQNLKINGIVQGVGFRPFVYQLAQNLKIRGEVSNTPSGVEIHLEGSAHAIKAFNNGLSTKAPPLAHIIRISTRPAAVKGFTDFSIIKSSDTSLRSTLISPDVSICDDCLRELFDPRNRRYGYPFINCTNCGPRYTIIKDIPYDRPFTSMKPFHMCPDCQSEYDDPHDRRFHAQPNACEKCGPGVTLYDRHQKKIRSTDPISAAVDLLAEGNILAVKGLGGFHLAVDAENSDAVISLRKRKHREEKPFAVMAGNPSTISSFAFLTHDEKKLLESASRPIVLLTKKEPSRISYAVSPGNRYIGVMLPYTPLHYLMLEKHEGAGLVMTSGNISDEPICIDNRDAFKKLFAIADFFLVHDREIYLRSDDSLVRHVAGKNRFIRRSRGYVPVPIFLKKQIPSILACGAGLKNTICLTKGDQAFLSQHIGDVENLPTYDFLRLSVKHMRRILDIEPEVVAHDLHPDYLSTVFAEEFDGPKKIAVQHHHAHIVSCMAENRIEGPVIGLSLDGTGHGSDGAVWGGEVLIAETASFTRAAHLSYVPMPGGNAAAKEPWRMAVSYLMHAFGHEYRNHNLSLLKNSEGTRLDIISSMITKKINSPDTSSLGRLFDGMASLLGIRDRASFEGQAAMELEMLAEKKSDSVYNHGWESGSTKRILLKPIIRDVVREIEAGVEKPVIAARFHATLIALFSSLCDAIRQETGLNRVVLSGGVFQNAILLNGLLGDLGKLGFTVFSHGQVPCNDGGISLGQAMVAAARTAS